MKKIVMIMLVMVAMTTNMAYGRSRGSSDNNAGEAAATQIVQHHSTIERLAEVEIWFKKQYGEEKFAEAGNAGFYIHIDKTRTHSIIVVLHWSGQMSVSEKNPQDGSPIYSGRGMWYPKFIPPVR